MMSIAQKPSVPQTGRQVLAIVLTALAAAAFYPQFSLSHDASWYLTATAMFLDGARLYIDIIEINPPLAFYLTVPPVALARAVGSDATTAYFLYAAALGLVAALWVLALLKTADLEPHQKTRLLAAVAVVLFLLPISEFGQREHLMLIFATPFLLGQVLRPNIPRLGVGHQIALGLFASLGLLLKPYFLVIPACIGIMRLFQERNARVFFDPGMLALALAAVAYAGFVLVVHPAYFGSIVPAAGVVYAAYGLEAVRVLIRYELLAAIFVLIAALRLNRQVRDPGAQLFISACVGAAAAYLLQFKGWNYHILPLSAWLVLIAVWLSFGTARNPGQKAFAVTILPLIAILAVGPQILRGPYQSATTDAFTPFVRPEDKTILVLSTNVWAAFPFVNDVSKKWASRYPAQWLIPGAYSCFASKTPPVAEMDCVEEKRILQEARDAIIDDMLRHRPEVIFIDQRSNKSYFGDSKFDYLQFLGSNPKFEYFFACYRQVAVQNDYGVFRINANCRSDAR